MAVMNAALYYVGIAILLGSIYVLKVIDIENVLEMLGLHAPLWMKGGKLDPQLHIGTTEDEISPERSSQWWTDDEQFQLERRAFFSKVRKHASS